jgi:hypothetical protein
VALELAAATIKWELRTAQLDPLLGMPIFSPRGDVFRAQAHADCIPGGWFPP